MDVSTLSEIVNNLGFPIAVCVALFWSNRETVKHYEKVILSFRKTLGDNTQALNKLINRMDK